MKALSLIQPYASFIVLGYKRIETRPWPVRYRGPIAIHASKGMPSWARAVCAEDPAATLIREHFGSVANLPRGSVVGTTEIIGCRRVTEGIEFTLEPLELALGDYRSGRYMWQLGTSPVVFEQPLVASGSLGLWDWDR